MTTLHQSCAGVRLLFVLCAFSSAALAADVPVNLLQLPSISVAGTTASVTDRGGLRAMTDGDRATAAVVTASERAPLDIVYAFGEETVSPEKLVVILPERDPAARVELLASTASAQSGFQVLRTARLEAKAGPQEFSFPASPARWIILRFTPAKGATRLGVAEVVLLGRPGAPLSHYAFKESPARALDVLAKLETTLSMNTSITKDEQRIFSTAVLGGLNGESFAEAALLASGATNREQRLAYLKRLAVLEAQARIRLADAKTPFEKGARLLEWLHAGPLKKGYVTEQTDLTTLLDTGTYNCVSSAALYAVLGSRLGLDVRAIEVPDHAFCIVYDGLRHADVETTTPRGFNPSRDPATVEKFRARTGFVYIPEAHAELRREIDGAGLVALIYGNHTVQFMRQRRYYDALLGSFRAMNLDREFPAAVKTALIALANWSVQLAAEQKYEQALSVLATGLQLAPEDARLVHNHRAVWSMWARAAIDGGDAKIALGILRRAAAAVPNGNFRAMESLVYLLPAEKRADAGEWEQALRAVDPGFKELAGASLEELRAGRVSLLLRWSDAELQGGEFEKAVAILERGIALDPQERAFRNNLLAFYDERAEKYSKSGEWSRAVEVYDGALHKLPGDKHLENNLRYAAQEWTKAAYAKAGAAAATPLWTTLLQRFPDLPKLHALAENHLRQVVQDFTKARRHEDALATLQRDGALLENPASGETLATGVYDQWADRLLGENRRQEAVDLYQKALTRFPASLHLKNNLAATFDEWVKESIDAKAWREAAKVCEAGLKSRPGEHYLTGSIPYIAQEWARETTAKEGAAKAEALLSELQKRFPNLKPLEEVSKQQVIRTVAEHSRALQHEEAIHAVQRAASLSLLTPGEAESTAAPAWGRWAETFLDRKAWAEGMESYRKALLACPHDRGLEEQALAAWHRWGTNLIEAKEWERAVGVFENALKQFPNDRASKKELDYCREQLKR